MWVVLVSLMIVREWNVENKSAFVFLMEIYLQRIKQWRRFIGRNVHLHRPFNIIIVNTAKIIENECNMFQNSDISGNSSQFSVSHLHPKKSCDSGLRAPDIFMNEMQQWSFIQVEIHLIFELVVVHFLQECIKDGRGW